MRSKRRRAPQDGELAFDDGEMPAEEAVSGESGEDFERTATEDPKAKGSVDGKELTELQKGFKERSAREALRFEAAVDVRYWFAVVCQTRQQKERLLEALGMDEVQNDFWIDGDLFSEALGLEYDNETPRPDFGRAEPKVSKRLEGLVDDVGVIGEK